MEKIRDRDNKIEPPVDFYLKLFERLKKLDISNGMRIIRFPKVFLSLASFYHLKKREVWSILNYFESQQLIKICPQNGVRILKEEGKKNVRTRIG